MKKKLLNFTNMYLIGDIGNTEVKIFLFNKNFIKVKKIMFKTKFISNNYLKKKLNFIKNNKIQSSLFSSVVPDAYKKIKNFLKLRFNIKCNELKNMNFSKLVKLKANRLQVGSDRIANAISVIDNKNNFIVVDFGTATTFDVIVKNTYYGGIIAPGVSLSLNTLIKKASLIPSINLSKVSKVVGTNTKLAVKSGFYWGYLGLIDNIIFMIKKQTKKPFKLIFTGGFAYMFKNLKKNKPIIKKDLTIHGLLKVIEKNN